MNRTLAGTWSAPSRSLAATACHEPLVELDRATTSAEAHSRCPLTRFAATASDRLVASSPLKQTRRPIASWLRRTHAKRAFASLEPAQLPGRSRLPGMHATASFPTAEGRPGCSPSRRSTSKHPRCSARPTPARASSRARSRSIRANDAIAAGAIATRHGSRPVARQAPQPALRRPLVFDHADCDQEGTSSTSMSGSNSRARVRRHPRGTLFGVRQAVSGLLGAQLTKGRDSFRLVQAAAGKRVKPPNTPKVSFLLVGETCGHQRGE